MTDTDDRRRWLCGLSGVILRSPLLAGLTGLAIGGVISLVISAVIR